MHQNRLCMQCGHIYGRLLHSSWIVLNRKKNNVGNKRGVMLEQEWAHNEDEGTRDKQTKRQNKRLPADFQSDGLHGCVQAWISGAYVPLSNPPSVSHHSHCSYRKRDILRFDSPGYIYTPLKEDEFIKMWRRAGIAWMRLNVSRAYYYKCISQTRLHLIYSACYHK